MRILVTGAAGFLGSHLCDAMLAEGHEVVGIDNFSTGRRSNLLYSDTDTITGDIADTEDLAKTGIGPWDVVYHFAASYRDRGAWEADARTNVLGTINVVREALRYNAKLIYFQTSLCYGPLHGNGPIQIGAVLDPVGSYAVSKTAGENYIRDSGLDFVSLRLANIYGPRNLSGPPPTFFMRLAEGQPCTVVDSRRDFVYVDDLIEVAVKAATQGQGFYHVSSGSDYAIAEVYDAIRAAMGIDAPTPKIIPRGPDDVPSLLLNPRETTREFGWTATTPLAEGMAKTVAWYQLNKPTETFTHLAEAKVG
jgi:UDP-glucose 4-epimerase